jgi:ribosomal protein S8
MKDKIPLFDTSGNIGKDGASGVRAINSDLSREVKRQTFGVGGYGGIDASKSYDKSKNEKVVDSGFNSILILGKDRHKEKNTGVGGLGGTNAGAIDLVCGLAGDKAPFLNAEGKVNIYQKDFKKDSARVYITQKGSVDYYYGIPKKHSEARSAVTGKADVVRWIGNENIRLQTGIDSQNARNWDVFLHSGVDILNGKDLSSLEPMVKGDRLIEYLRQQETAILDLQGVVVDLSKLVERLMDKLAKHTHISPFQTSIKDIKYTQKSFDLIKFRAKERNEVLKIRKQMKKNTIEIVKTRNTHLSPTGELFINSKYHKVN